MLISSRKLIGNPPRPKLLSFHHLKILGINKFEGYQGGGQDKSIVVNYCMQQPTAFGVLQILKVCAIVTLKILLAANGTLKELM